MWLIYVGLLLVQAMIVVVDTETTALPAFSTASHEDVALWPRMVSVAWCELKNGPVAPPEQCVIFPDGFTIPASSTKIHGISHEDAVKTGMPLDAVLERLVAALGNEPADVVICCYNAPFDRGVLLSEARRQKCNLAYDFLVKCKWQCVMNHVSRLMEWKLHKKLSDAAREVGVDTTGAQLHTAAGDVTLTLKLMKKIAVLVKNRKCK